MFYLSYRLRLFFYSIILMAFLSGTLIYSYHYVQTVMLQEADNHLLRMKQLLIGSMNADNNELQRHATIVSRDSRLKEYLFVVTGIGGDSDALKQLYERQFGWLPVHRRIILSNDDEILIGKNQTDLAVAVRKNLNLSEKGLFYFPGKNGLEVAAVSPIRYRDNIQGRVAVTSLLDQQWLNQNKAISGGEFFLVQNGEIINSTLDNISDTRFLSKNNRLTINNTPLHLFRIDLHGSDKLTPQLWFGLSETEILKRLDQHRQFTVTLVGAGLVGILLMGLMIIRNFSRPLQRLINITRKVSEGSLPHLSKNKIRNEVDELSNHFSDMLQALRQHQDEIDITHAKLEQSAITDTLTKLYNRRYLLEVFPKLLAQAKRDKLCVFGIILDLDFFKKINDTHGHIVGDRCLQHFSELLKQESRNSDYVFRLGGEEFLILTVSENILSASNFADKIRTRLEQTPLHSDDTLIKLTVSGGVSYAKPKGSPETTLNQMLSRADIALYQAKHAGRNRICASNTDDDTESFSTEMKA